MTTEAAPPRKHPLDWKKEKKTPEPAYRLACAVAWHARLRLDDAATYDGVVVDPLGDETSPCTVEQYDGMISAAQKLFADTKAQGPTLKPPVQPKHVRILMHPDAHHAVIVKLPVGGDANAIIVEQRNAAETGIPGAVLDAKTNSFSNRMLWPADGSPEKQDLMDFYNMAFRFVYPEEYLKLAGATGVEIKKLA